MKKFVMSMYENKEALYKARAEYFEAQLRFIVKEMCFDLCKKFRIDEDIEEEDFFAELMDAVEEKRCEKKLRIANELEKLDVVKPYEKICEEQSHINLVKPDIDVERENGKPCDLYMKLNGIPANIDDFVKIDCNYNCGSCRTISKSMVATERKLKKYEITLDQYNYIVQELLDWHVPAPSCTWCDSNW